MVCHCRYYFRFGSRGERGGGENYTSIILIGIVVIFFICHTPRNIMNWYDFISVESALFCQANKKSHFPPYWIYFLFMLGESLVVLNSSINFSTEGTCRGPVFTLVRRATLVTMFTLVQRVLHWYENRHRQLKA